MSKSRATLSFVLAFVVICTSGCSSSAARPQQQTAASALLQLGGAGRVFSLTTSSAATYSSINGALEPMPSTSLGFEITTPGFATISFAARGSVEPSGTQLIPKVLINCQIDGQSCSPDSNSVEFLYPQFCCDVRSFQWIAPNLAAGSHIVQILWGMDNPTSASITDRSVIVQTALQ